LRGGWLSGEEWLRLENQYTFDVNLSIALRASLMHIPTNIDVRAALIPATVIEHSMIVVTRNAKHIVNTGAKLVNSWL
jgi:toxin FitB